MNNYKRGLKAMTDNKIKNRKKSMANEMRIKNKQELSKIQKYESMGIQVGRLYTSHRLPVSK